MDEFGGDRSDDVVEQGGDRLPGRLTGLIAGRSRRPGWRPSRGAAILAAITLAAGLAVGYGAGRSAGESQAAAQSAGARPSPTPRASAFSAAPAVPDNPTGVRRIQLQSTVGGPVLTQASGACSAQVGRDLQLGIQVANLTAGQVTLRRVAANLPMGGLKMVSQQWEPCGGLPTGYYDTGDVVGPNSTSWFSVTFRVLVKCPRPYPVMFTVEYDVDGHATTARLPGFADLTHVSY